LDKIEKSFRFEGVSVANRENDLVFRVYDGANDILSRFVYTVYYSGGASTTNNQTTSGGGAFNVQTYNVDGTKFTFTAPTTGNTYTTSENFITIR
jgi:hypothetical protein